MLKDMELSVDGRRTGTNCRYRSGPSNGGELWALDLGFRCFDERGAQFDAMDAV